MEVKEQRHRHMKRKYRVVFEVKCEKRVMGRKEDATRVAGSDCGTSRGVLT